MTEGKTFSGFLATLPAGGMTGVDATDFGVASGPPNFVPPTLNLVEGTLDPNITLVSARGATGKTALSKQVSSVKQVPRWDLGHKDAKAVSGDAFEGRLGTFLHPAVGLPGFRAQRDAFVVVDALDEARIRVSGQSWDEFLGSVAAASSDGHRFALFGRERVLEDVWITLSDAGRRIAWFEISHFDAAQRASYVDMHVRKKRDLTSGLYTGTRDSVLQALAGSVQDDEAEAFVGYAPVLDAVVALLRDANLKSVQNDFDPAAQDGAARTAVLAGVLEKLLLREQQKVEPLARQSNLDPAQAHTPAEQLVWLNAALLRGDVPALDWCPAEQRSDYVRDLQPILDDHPFRNGDAWASPVFSAYVAADRFDDEHVRPHLQGIGASTGLLFEFLTRKGDALLLDEWQFAALHASMLAAEWQAVEPLVELRGKDPEQVGPEESEEVVPGTMTLLDRNGLGTRRTSFELVLDRPGRLRLLGPLSSVSVIFGGEVVLAAGRPSVVLGPDCFVRCRRLNLEGDTVKIGRRVAGPLEQGFEDAEVILEATEAFHTDSELTGSTSPASLELRVPADLRLVYPWVMYRHGLEDAEGPVDDRAVRFLNMLMNLVRAHGHNNGMAVFDKKLEGRQSVKSEEFARVIAALSDMHVVDVRGELIFLAEDWVPFRFSGKQRPGRTTLSEPATRERWRPVLDRIAATLA